MGKEYRHLRVLRECLLENADEDVSSRLLDGMDYIKDSSGPAIKAQWAEEITRRLDACLDAETNIRIRENCACIKSDKKSIYAQTFRRLRKRYENDFEYVCAAIEYLNSTAPLRRCGDVSLEKGKIVTVIARGHCNCQVIAKGLKNPLSVTWCHCCKGSILSVMRYIFPRMKCKMTIRETCASGGTTCTFENTFVSME